VPTRLRIRQIVTSLHGGVGFECGEGKCSSRDEQSGCNGEGRAESGHARCFSGGIGELRSSSDGDCDSGEQSEPEGYANLLGRIERAEAIPALSESIR